MNESRLKELVDELDRTVPKEGAVISFHQYGGGPDESKIVGSRVGLLRAGVELLRAGVGPGGESKDLRSLTDLYSITHIASEFRFDYFEETTLPDTRAQEEKNAHTAKWIAIGLFCIVLVTVGLAVYGLVRLFY